MSKFSKNLAGAAILTFLLVGTASTAAIVPCTGLDCTICHFLVMLKNILDFLVKMVMPPLAGLMFLVGGIMMIAGGASEENYKKGRDIMKNALIGVLIVLASWAIINTLIVTFGRAVDGFTPISWWKVECK
ncbi:MAG: hypothetical protein PHW33_00640 [Candidatus Portnoybacteria bacterium]|jgi:hypothetical protein|nr:hypothetical protein [Candidatus Portnoybacteria bacterium]